MLIISKEIKMTMKKIVIGFHNGEGAGRELISGVYHLCRVLNRKIPEIEMVRIPELYTNYAKMNPHAKRVFDNVKNKQGAVISGAISGDNTYHLRSSYKFLYKLVEIKPIPCLYNISPLKNNVRKHIDWLIIRHNKGILTIAKERWIRKNKSVQWYTTYNIDELKKLAEIAFTIARKRKKKLVLLVKSKQHSKVVTVWSSAFESVAQKYQDVEFKILNPDYASADAIVNPKGYDVFFMPDMIGDLMADVFVTLINGNRNFDGTGNFSLKGFSYYNTLHGAACDIAGKNIVNPVGTIACLALMFKYSFNREDIYNIIRTSLDNVLKNYRTIDALAPKTKKVSTSTMFKLVEREVQKMI